MKKIFPILLWWLLPFMLYQCNGKPSSPDDPFKGNDTIAPIDTSNIPLPSDTIAKPVITDSSTVYVYWSETAFNSLHDGALYSENAQVRIVNPYPDRITISIDNADVSVVSDIPDIHFSLQGEHHQASFALQSPYSTTVVLDGLRLCNDQKARVLYLNSEKDALIYLTEGSINELSDLSNLNDSTKACIYAQTPLSFSGNGQLIVNSLNHHGISSSQGVYIQGEDAGSHSFNCRIQAGKDAIHCHKYFQMEGGKLSAETLDDGIQCETGSIVLTKGDIILKTIGDKSHDLTCDNSVMIQDGKIELNVLGAASKGIKAGGDIIIKGGDISISCTGNSIYDENNIDLSSSSGIKGNGQFYFSGDTTRLNIVSSGIGGKGLNIDGNITIENGEIRIITQGERYRYNETLFTSAKAIKCNIFCLDGGVLDVTTTGGEGSDGIDCERSFIQYDGLCRISASDDAVKAGTTINIHGGELYAQSALNDGLDALSGIQILGGKVFSAGSSADKKGGFETEGVLLISGGEVMAVGNKNTKPDSRSTQYCVCLRDEQSYSAGEILSFAKWNETTALLQGTLPQAYDGRIHILFSSPLISKGNKYEIRRGDALLRSIDINSTITDLK